MSLHWGFVFMRVGRLGAYAVGVGLRWLALILASALDVREADRSLQGNMDVPRLPCNWKEKRRRGVYRLELSPYNFPSLLIAEPRNVAGVL